MTSKCEPPNKVVGFPKPIFCDQTHYFIPRARKGNEKHNNQINKLLRGYASSSLQGCMGLHNSLVSSYDFETWVLGTYINMKTRAPSQTWLRCRPAVRISGFHPGDPGSIPGNGIFFSSLKKANGKSVWKRRR
jgi:hypothetical protein